MMIWIKNLFNFFLKPYESGTLEAKKKSQALLSFLITTSVLGLLIFFVFLSFGKEGITLLPFLINTLCVGLALVLLQRGLLDVATNVFIIGFFLTLTLVPFLDPYDEAFEIYRYAFFMMFILTISPGIVRRVSQLMMVATLTICGLILVYSVRFGLMQNQFWVPLNFITFLVIMIMMSSAGFISALLFRLNRQILETVEANEVQAILHRDSFARFLPTEFLKFLNKDSILQIQLGDCIKKFTTIMFADIRNFTGLSETMEPNEVLTFLNNWMGRIEPVIRQNNGFVDKYLGDGVMVLFPHKPEDAIQAGIEMLRALEDFNHERTVKGQIPIKIGIGLNYGETILGTIGGIQRMDGTVVSDSVNIAAHIESLTKYFKTPLLVSRGLLFQCENMESFSYRFIDTVKVKGRLQTIEVFEILNGLNKENRSAILASKIRWEQGIKAFQSGSWKEALQVFTQLLKEQPNDHPTFVYKKRCEDLLQSLCEE